MRRARPFLLCLGLLAACGYEQAEFTMLNAERPSLRITSVAARTIRSRVALPLAVDGWTSG